MIFFRKIFFAFYILHFTFYNSLAQSTTDEQLAVHYFQSGECDKAVMYYEKLYEKNPSEIYYGNYLKCLLNLEKYKEELLNRKDSGKVFRNTNKFWYEYWDPKPISFSHPKIVFPDISNHNQFSLDLEGYGYLNTCYGIFLKDPRRYKSILAILNSRLIEFFIKKISPSVRGGFYRYQHRWSGIINMQRFN